MVFRRLAKQTDSTRPVEATAARKNITLDGLKTVHLKSHRFGDLCSHDIEPVPATGVESGIFSIYHLYDTLILLGYLWIQDPYGNQDQYGNSLLDFSHAKLPEILLSKRASTELVSNGTIFENGVLVAHYDTHHLDLAATPAKGRLPDTQVLSLFASLDHFHATFLGSHGEIAVVPEGNEKLRQFCESHGFDYRVRG